MLGYIKLLTTYSNYVGYGVMGLPSVVVFGNTFHGIPRTPNAQPANARIIRTFGFLLTTSATERPASLVGEAPVSGIKLYWGSWNLPALTQGGRIQALPMLWRLQLIQPLSDGPG